MNLGDRLGRAFPWGVEVGVRSVVLTAGCGVGLIVVWWGVGDRGVFATQVGWLAAGVAMLMVSLYAHASLVIRGRRAVGARRAGLISDGLVDLLPLQADVPVTNGSAREGLGISDVLVVEGLGMFHLAGCAMTACRDVTVVSRRAAVGEGLEGCGICCRPGVVVVAGGGEGVE